MVFNVNSRGCNLRYPGNDSSTREGLNHAVRIVRPFQGRPSLTGDPWVLHPRLFMFRPAGTEESERDCVHRTSRSAWECMTRGKSLRLLSSNVLRLVCDTAALRGKAAVNAPQSRRCLMFDSTWQTRARLGVRGQAQRDTALGEGVNQCTSVRARRRRRRRSALPAQSKMIRSHLING